MQRTECIAKRGTDKTIDRYRYNQLDLIGQGASGAVYSGYHIQTGEKVAVKVVSKLAFSDLYCLSSLQSEVNIMRRLKHPNIVQLLDIYQTHRNVYVVTELCESDLRTWMKRCGRATEEQAKSVLRDIIAGFRYLTTNGVLHRDLKPANLLLKGGVCKLGDFGFARNLDKGADTVLMSVVGTPLYMSPQLLSHLSYTSKSDLWALGLIFYELLHGRTPWVAHSELELLRKILHEPIEYSARISPAARSFIAECLTVDEQERLSWEQAFSHPILGPSGVQSPGKPIFNLHRNSNKQNIKPLFLNQTNDLTAQKGNQSVGAADTCQQRTATKGGGKAQTDRQQRTRSISIREIRMSRAYPEGPLMERRAERTPTNVHGISRDLRGLA